MGARVKHIVYKYGDDPRSDEMGFDPSGSLALAKGDIISRHEISWRIEAIEREPSVDGIMRIPTYWVYLSRVLVK